MNPTRLDFLRAVWGQDLGTDITDDQWDCMVDLVHKSSIRARHCLLQCKILYRSHYTNARLTKIYPDRSDSYNRCKQSPADHIHMLWSCPKLSLFWLELFNILGKVLGSTIDPGPLTALFGVLQNSDMPSSSKQVSFYNFTCYKDT